MTQGDYSRACRLALTLAALAGVTSCTGLEFGDPSPPLGSGPADIVTPLRIRLIDKPRDIVGEYTYPSGLTHQAFAWGDFGGEWRVRPANQPYVYAGFIFRKPHNLTPVRDAMVLSFRLRPMNADADLSVALVDGTRTPERVLVDMPLKSHRIWERRGWGLYAIRLTDFSDGGVRLEGTGGEASPLDWSDISEIRLIAQTSRAWDQSILIRNLQFGQIPWAMRMQMASPARDPLNLVSGGRLNPRLLALFAARPNPPPGRKDPSLFPRCRVD